MVKQRRAPLDVQAGLRTGNEIEDVTELMRPRRDPADAGAPADAGEHLAQGRAEQATAPRADE